MKPQKKKVNVAAIFLSIVLVVLIALVVLVVLSLLEHKLKFSIENLKETLVGKWYWKIVLIGFVGILGFLGTKLINKLGKKTKDFSEGEDARLFTKEEMKRSKQFNLTKFEELELNDDGIVLGAEEKRKKLEVILTREPQHTLVIGTTGSGKTTGFLDPTIQILSKTKTKPSLIISDPKGELFERHSEVLNERGYKVHVLDLLNPYQSTRWNPFSYIQKLLIKLEELKADIEKWEKELEHYVKNKWKGQKELEDKIYDLQIEKQTVEDDIYESTVDLVYTICPIEEKSADTSWQYGARDFILGVVLAFVEDIKLQYFKPDKLTLANVYHNISTYAQGSADELRTYLEVRDIFSQAKGKAATVLSAFESEKTFASYLTAVSSYMQWLTDRGIQAMTSDNDINFDQFDEEPTVLFIQVPDEKVTRHRLVSLLIMQCYKTLIEKARRNEKDGTTDSSRLKRRMYFLLDEFGNLPKFEQIDSMISVGRSRWVYFMFILQNLEQLDQKYGANVAKIVKDNCPVKMFLGTDSIATMEEFCKLAGKRKGESVSLSSGSGKNGASATTSIKEIPLITISDLKTLNSKDNFGNALVSAFGYPLFYSKFTPSWKSKKYLIGRAKGVKRKQEIFDIKHNLLDVAEWNKSVEEYKKFCLQMQEPAVEQEKKEEHKKKIEEKKPVVKPKKTRVLRAEDIREYLTEGEYIQLTTLKGKERIKFIEELLRKTVGNVALQLILKALLEKYKGEEERGLEA